MKKIITATLVFFIALNAFAQEPFTRYISIQGYSGLSVISLNSFDDFLDMTKQAKVTSAFIMWTKENRSLSTVVIKASDIYYSYNLKGFSNVGDYQKGLKTGFSNGGDYYDAVSLGLANNELYAFYIRNNFASIEDCKKALANGFARGKEEIPPHAVLPVEISVERAFFLNPYLPALTKALNRSHLVQTAPEKSEPDYNKIDDKVYRLVSIGSFGDAERTQFGKLQVEAIQLLTKIQAESDSAIRGRLKKELEVVQKAMKELYKRDLSFLISIRNRVLENWTNSSGYDRERVFGYEPVAITGAKPPDTKSTESQVFYWADANGIVKYDDYVKFVNAVENNYLSVKDQEIGKLNGFKAGAEFYDAMIRGFSNEEDYSLANNLMIFSFDDFKPIKVVADSINAIMKKEGKKFDESAIIYLLTIIPRGKSYSIPSIIEYLNKNILVTEEYKSYKEKFLRFSEAQILAFLKKNPILSIGKWDAEGGVFVRN